MQSSCQCVWDGKNDARGDALVMETRSTRSLTNATTRGYVANCKP